MIYTRKLFQNNGILYLHQLLEFRTLREIDKFTRYV